MLVLPLQGLPRDAEVAALRQLFEPLAGLRDIRLPMLPVDRHGDGGVGCRGYAFLVSAGLDPASCRVPGTPSACCPMFLMVLPSPG